MKPASLRKFPIVFRTGRLVIFAAILLTGCVAAGYDDGVGVNVGYVGGFYEPWGYDYGGWGRGYRVGPPRGGFVGGGRGGHAPSIPQGPRGGGHGGGGHR